MFYFRRADGAESEPLTLDELVELVRSGAVQEETLIRAQGRDDWKPAWRIPALQSAFGLSVSAASPAPAVGARAVTGAVPPPTTRSAPPSPAATEQPLVRQTGVNWRLALMVGIPVGMVAAGLPHVLPGPTVTTRDGRMQLKLGSGWHVRDPGPDYEFQADTDQGETVVLGGSVPIAPDEPVMSLSAFDYSLIQGPISQSPDYQDLGVHTYTADGQEFLRHEFKGTLNGRSGRFILVNTKTPSAFYRLVAATSAEQANRRTPDLEKLVLTFRPKK